MNQSPLSVFQTRITGQPEPASSPIIAEWESPSNIALVKYWGKKEEQIPANPSLSMTLKRSITRTSVRAIPSGTEKKSLTVNGDPDHIFASKLRKLAEWLASEISVLEKYSLDVTTSNTFPHSAGIASSASGISAFTLCILTIISKITGKEITRDEFFRIASCVSRMGSGSACRSVYGGFSLWGETKGLEGSSDLYAIPIGEKIHADFMKLHDAILVVSSSPKSIPSSAGHDLMKSHPFAGVRFEQARNHIYEILDALHLGDIEKLAVISENEALTLHSLIMSSTGGSILLEPNSLLILQKIRQARYQGLPVFFSIDAGPNVHLIYPEKNKNNVEKFIAVELEGFCENGQVIFDQCGAGPGMIKTDKSDSK